MPLNSKSVVKDLKNTALPVPGADTELVPTQSSIAISKSSVADPSPIPRLTLKPISLRPPEKGELPFA